MKNACLFLITFCAIVCAYGQGVKPEKGDGTQARPYQIESIDNLLWINSDKEYITGQKYFKQMNDIDISSISSWTPIGVDATHFNGNYDGNGHVIKGLTMKDGNRMNAGVFGYTEGATISNLGVVDVNISENSTLGAIVGYALNTRIYRCFSKGAITASGSNCGGLVGTLIGQVSQITQSYSTAHVSGDENVGGLAGNVSNFVKITNSYAISKINSNKLLAGGIVGLLGKSSRVDSCYSASVVYGTYSEGIAFTEFQNAGTVENCYWDGELFSSASTQTGANTTAALKNKETYTMLDFIVNPAYNDAGIWAISSDVNTGYPCLAWQVRPRVIFDTVTAITDTSATISATIFAPSIEGKAMILYGDTDAFNVISSTTRSPLTASANTEISQGATKLKPNTEYYYMIETQNSAGTFRVTTQSFITRPAAPIVADVTYCVGAAANSLTASGTSLKWYNSETGGTALIAAPIPQTTNAGVFNYWVSQTLSLGGESPRAKVTVKVTANPNVTLSFSKKPICDGDTILMLAKGADSYTWTIEQQDSIISESKNKDSILFNPHYSETITLTGTASSCSTTISEAVTVHESRLLVGYDSITQPSCELQTGIVYFSGLPNGDKYWQILLNGNTVCSSNLSKGLIQGLHADSAYYFRLKTFYGCLSRDSVKVVIDPAPIVPNKPTVSDVTYCQNQAVEPFQFTGTVKLKWYASAEASSPLAVAPVPSSALVGEKSYWVSDSVQCESERSQFKVTVKPLPVVAITDTIIRLGKSLNLNYGTPNNGIYSINKTPYISFTPKILGISNVLLQFTDNNNCSNIDSAKISVIPASITVKPIPSVSLTVGETSKTYLFDSLFSDSMPLTFSVLSNNNAVVSPAITERGFGLIAYTGGTAQLRITATASDGTTGVFSCTVQVTGKPIDNCTMTITDNVHWNKCFADQTGSIDVTVSGGTKPYYYKWSNTSSAEDLSNLSAGEYSLVVRDTLGCVATKNFTLLPQLPLQLSVEVKPSACGQADGAISLSANGGTAPYTMLWSDASTQTVKTALAAGVYTVTLSDANACSFVKQIELSNSGAPSIVVDSIRASACSKAEGGIWLHAMGGAPKYSYRWNDASSDSIRTQLVPGSYQVTLTDAANCLATAAIDVKSRQFAQPSISLVTVSKKTKTNLIVWLRERTEQIAYYTIYRQNTKGVYDSVGFRLYDSVSVFTDSFADPAKHAWRYKISASNLCHQKSALSTEYKTMRIRVNRGLESTVNIDWDSYEGSVYSTYYIYRNTKSQKGELIDSVPANVYDYSDIHAPLDVVSYYVAVDLPAEVNPFLFKSDTGPFSQSLSNMSEASLVSEPEMDATNFNTQAYVYPNPTNDLVSIQIGAVSILGDVHVIASDARMCNLLPYSSTDGLHVFSIKNLSAGIYTLVIPTDKAIFYKKLVVVQ